MSRVLGAVALMLSFVLFTQAQSEIQFRGSLIKLDSPAKASKTRLSKGAPTMARRQFWILRLSEPQSAKQIQNLSSLGLILGQSIGNGYFIASSNANTSISNLATAGVAEIAEYPSAIRLSQGLKDKLKLQAKNSRISINLVPHSGLSEISLRKNWKESWGQISEVWDGYIQKWSLSVTSEGLSELATQEWIQWLEESEGDIVPFNQNTASNARGTFVGLGLDGLDGKGVKVAVGDGGRVELHADLQSHQKNLTSNKIALFADHQDHVTGIIAGAGLLQADKKGLAPGLTVYNHQTSSVISLAASLRQNYGVTLINNSYGVNLNCSRAGNYSSTSSFLDAQMNSQTDILHVFAAGNQGGSACSPFPGGYNTISEGYPVSKNALTVGSSSGQDQFAWFSSRGPVRDGRVKPEIVANGNQIFSTVPFDAYGEKGGTSMAAPVLTGVLALLTQQYKISNNQELPEAALLKALVCNTAEDLGQANVDYSYGYGRVNARRARRSIVNQWFRSGTIVSNGLNQFNVTAPANAKGLKVMLSWSDPAATSGATKALINNLDLNVLNGSGITFLPWVLNPAPASVGLAATRKVDTLNNMEQVTLPVNGGENISIKVNAKLISGINQKYWITYEWQMPELILTSPGAGTFVQAGQSIKFQWDMAEMNPSQMVLESSLDSVSGFAQVSTINNPMALFQSIVLPNSSFEKRYYRLNATVGSDFVLSNVSGIAISQKPNLSIQSCNQTASLTWNLIPEATKYEILKLDLSEGKWNSIGFTNDNRFLFNQLENNIRYGFAVRPWFGNSVGMQSDGKMITPAPGNCPWNPDLGIASIIKPESVRLETPSASQQIPASVNIQNFGNQAITAQYIVIFYQVGNGTTHQFNHYVSLQAGESQTVVLPQVVLPTTAGTFELKVWHNLVNDLNVGNDTLKHSFRLINNPPLALPWSFNAENLPGQTINNDAFAISGADFLQFTSSEAARLRTSISPQPEYFGVKSIYLDKSNIDGKTGTSDLIFTLNLAQYALTDQLILDFDWLPLGSLSVGNSLWVRTNETAEWKEVKRFWQETYIPSQSISFIGINLKNYFLNEALTSSFQIKFTFSGLRPSDIPLGGGYAIDNLLLSIPVKDVVVKRLLGPSEGCVDNAIVKKVKVRLLNNSDSALSNSSIGYQIIGQNPVVETVPFIAAHDSLDYEFTDSIPKNLVGKLLFKIWVRSQSDNYPTNDTIRNLSVFISPKVSTFPYYEGFETNDGKWKSYGEKSSWAWGKPSPSLTIIDTAANGKNIWATNLSGNYNGNELSYLESPCFDVQSLTGDFQFSFNSIQQLEQEYDFAWLEMSEDGTGWTKVGQKGSGTNWYNHDSHQWTGTKKHWSVNSINISQTGILNKKNVRFRFAFSSDISLSFEGIGIDDIHIEPGLSILIDSSFQQSSPQSFITSWVQFGKGKDIVAEIEKRPELGAIDLQMKKNEGAMRFSEYIPYLDRNYYIKPEIQPTAPVKVRLFIKDEELSRLQEFDPNLESFQQMGIYKYDGPNEDLTLANNSEQLGNHEFIKASQVLKVPTAGGYFLEFQISSFSEFYIASQTLVGGEEVLPVKLISFLANRNGNEGQVELEWKTASESNCDRFELSYSCDGKRFAKIADVRPQGKENQGFTYTKLHTPASCSAPNLIYKLSQFETGKTEAVLEMKAVCANPNFGGNTIQIVNPAREKLTISGLNGATQIELSDILGRPMASFSSDESTTEQDISTLPAGNYFVRIKGEVESKTYRVLKQ